MILLLIFLWPVAELYTLIEVGSRIGVANTIFAVLLSMVLGFGIVRTQGVFLLRKLQASIAQGQVPQISVLQSALVFVGGVLFIVPGFLSDLVGLFLLLPGTRHLAAAYLRARITRNISEGSFRVFTSGFDFRASSPFSPPPPPGSETRDVSPRELEASSEIIDVTPLDSKNSSHENS